MIGPLSGFALIAMFTLLFSLGSDDGSSDPEHVVCFRQNIVVLTAHFCFIWPLRSLFRAVTMAWFGWTWIKVSWC